MAAKATEPVESEYAVGYRPPPVHSRFQKGRSGNPGGRPRGMTPVRANTLALKEAYRTVTVKEGDRVIRMPAIQAVLRSQVSLAAKGNGPAQRAMLETIQTIEREISQARQEEQVKQTPPVTNLEAARAIAFVFAKAAHEKELAGPEE